MEVFFLKIPEIYLQNCLLEDHCLYKNTKVYLPQYSDAYFLCFISSRPEVLCKNVVLKNFLKTKNLLKVIFLDNRFYCRMLFIIDAKFMTSEFTFRKI